MDSTLEKLQEILVQITQEEYVTVATLVIVLISIFFVLSTYFLSRQKKKLRATLDNNLKVFQKAFDISDDAVLILSPKNNVMYASNTMVRLLDLKSDFLSKSLKSTVQIKVKKEWVGLEQFIQEHRTSPKDKVHVFPHATLKISEEDEIPVNVYLDTVVMEMPKEILCDVISIQDLSKAKERSAADFKHPLTHLPNQLQVYNDLPAFFSKAHLEKNKLALMLMSLDNLSRLRSIIGDEQTNDIIKKFARYLETLTKNVNVSVYHTFDNHFLLTVTNLNSIDEAKVFVEDIQKKLATFYKMDGVHLHLTVSAGIALYPDSGDIRLLLDHAYKALAEAEKEGDNNITIFLPEKFTAAYDELRLHSDMPRALSNGEFEVYYQPIVRVGDQEVVAAEALIRWKHPQYGMIPPDVFISLMEKTGFIVKLGQFILDEVLKQQKRWELFNFKNIEVSINVSMVEINTGEFVQHVERKLAEHQLDPECIKFEITEGIAMLNEAQTVKYFLALKKLGVGISLDDFGTGYTSFGYLKKFPADIVKIDKSLVDYILTNEEDQRIVKAIIELAHTLGMKIVVEGIENQQMVDMITSYGCDYLQGYHFSKPLPVFEFQKLIR
jgi:polar amino acid transport system substrate-binding protein